MITIITTDAVVGFHSHDEWGRDPRDDVHIYDGNETVATFDGDDFVALIRGPVDAVADDERDHYTYS